MSDPRDDAFRALLDVARKFNRSPSLTRRSDVEGAARRLVKSHHWADFPSDEDVEVACKAFNGTYRDNETREWLQSPWRHDIEDMRAALQAIADARRTEEE